jgi:hypothetical protein
MLIMHPAAIIVVFGAGLYENGRLKTTCIISGMARGYLDILIKPLSELNLREVLRSAYSQI